MKSFKLIQAALLAAGMTLSGLALADHHEGGAVEVKPAAPAAPGKAKPSKPAKAKAAKKAKAYSCPMHPEVKSGKPGKCPKCNMDLVKK